MAKDYDGPYRRARKAWAVVVDAGQAWCSEPVCKMPGRWIAPGSKWHLSHNPERTMVIGPSHAFCNMAEGGRRGNPKGVAKRPQKWRPSRTW